MTNHQAGGKLRAFSAGSQPAQQVHPLTLKFLAERGLPTEGLSSQSWLDPDLVTPDLVITVCDRAADESCPIWLQDTTRAHWGLPDPSKLTGSEAELRNAFYEVMNTIERRVQAVLALDLPSVPVLQRQQLLNELIRGVN
jgi:arsenate reductase